MTDAQLTTEDNQLSIKQTFNATASRLFACFTQPELLNQWHSPTESITTKSEVNLVVGGSYRISMADPENKTHTAIGVFKEIIEPSKLVYSWHWEGSEDPETTVTVEFHQTGHQTEVTLTHQNLPSSEAVKHHSQGWSAIFTRLSEFC